MKWSWSIGRLFGIRLQIHWTFLLLLGWILVTYLQTHETVGAAITAVAFLLSVFGCIILHELGHALMARRFGIQTQDITLLPIGGVARLQRMPEEPTQELLVAAAGPAVNVVIASLLAAILALIGDLGSATEVTLTAGSFFARLMMVNIALIVFNLLPAFPMDGGRMLRALLAYRLSYVKATNIAAGVGQAMAIAFGLLGFLSGNLLLIFIGIFVYLGAGAEAQTTRVRDAFRDVPVREAMMTEFHTLSEDDTLDAAVDELLAGSQQDFPVLSGGELRGLLQRDDLIRALADEGRYRSVRGVMRDACTSVSADASLQHVFRMMQQTQCKAIPVMGPHGMVGLLTLENISEWLMVRDALDRGENHDRDAHPSIERLREYAGP